MSNRPQRSFAVNFSRGFSSPFRSLGLLRGNPRLILYILVPFLINVVVFSAVVWLGVDFFGSTVVEHLPRGDAWYWAMLSWLVWLIAALLTAVLVFFSFTVVGNLLASPFNDLLSERTEEVLTGRISAIPFSFRQFASDVLKTILMEAKKMSLFVVVMLLILPLNLLPGFGTALYTLLAISLTLLFICFEYLSFVMVRKQQFFSAQRRYIFGRKFLMLGFACGVMALLAIPFMQLFCLPLAVIGATRLWCEEAGLVLPEAGAAVVASEEV